MLTVLDYVMRYFRPLIVFLALLVAMPVVAQTSAEPTASDSDDRPPALAPLDDDFEPEVSIRQQDGDTIEEYRVNGRLYKIRVIPLRGEPYILIDRRGDGAFVRHDGPGSPGLSLPMWAIGTF